MTVDIIPDKKYDIDNVKLGYMEDYFLDEDSQLEKRLAIGDSSFLDGLKEKDKKIMIGKHICTNVNDTKKSLKLFSELPKTNSTRINKEL